MNWAELVIARRAMAKTGKIRFIVNLGNAEKCDSFVNAVLFLGPVHLYCDLLLGLVDLDVVPVSLKPGRNRLDPKLAVGNRVHRGLAVEVGLQFHPILGLLTLFIYRMQNYAGVAHRFTVIAPQYQELDARELVRSKGGRRCQRKQRQSRNNQATVSP